MPGARAVLRRITDLGGTTSFDEVQQYFASHPTIPIAPAKLGGTLTSIKAAQRRIGPAGSSRLLQRNERARLYHIDRPLVEGLRQAFAIADAAPTCCAANPPHLSPDPGRIVGRRASHQRTQVVGFSCTDGFLSEWTATGPVG